MKEQKHLKPGYAYDRSTRCTSSQSKLRTAIDTGDVSLAREALKTLVWVDTSSFDMAIISGSEPMVSFLLDQPLEPSLIDGELSPHNISAGAGLMNIHTAALSGHAPIVNLLVERGADIQMLTYQCEDGFMPIDRTPEGMNVFHLAAIGDHADTLDALIKQWGQVLSIDVQDEDGYTPLMRAAEMGLWGPFEMLWDCGAQMSATNKNGKTAYQLGTPQLRALIDERMLKETLSPGLPSATRSRL